MRSVSLGVRVLGYGGLIPFVALTLGVMMAGKMAAFWMAWALAAYGAVIFSFIGAIHWGVALTRDDLDDDLRNRALVWGIIPPLLASGCLLLPHGLALLGLAVLGVVVLLMDIYLDRQLPMPEGWIRLRVHLTLVACASLTVSGFVLPSFY